MGRKCLKAVSGLAVAVIFFNVMLVPSVHAEGPSPGPDLGSCSSCKAMGSLLQSLGPPPPPEGPLPQRERTLPQSQGCCYWVCREWVHHAGYISSGCYTPCAVVCSFITNPYLKAACYASCAVACWVPPWDECGRYEQVCGSGCYEP